jgi:hypothetical protein
MYMGLYMLGRQIHTAVPLVPAPSAFEVEMAIEKLKRHTSPGIDQIPAELIIKQGIGQFTLRSINLLIQFRIRKNCLRSGRSQSQYLFIRMVIKQTVVIIEAYHFCQLCTKFYLASCC